MKIRYMGAVRRQCPWETGHYIARRNKMDWVFWTNWTTNFFYLFWIISLSCTQVTLLWVLAGKLFERLGYFTATGFLLKGMILFWLLSFGHEVHKWWELDERNLFVYKGGFVPEKWMEILGYIFGVIWISGVVAGLIRYIYRMFRLNRCIAKTFPCDKEILNVFEHVKKEYKIKKKCIIVCCSYENNGAKTARVFRPVILLPAHDFSEEELLVIFRHELMHIKNHDLLFKNLAEILCIIHFLNPFVFWLKKQVDRWMEYVCDYKVCMVYGNVKGYYGTILDFAEKCDSSQVLVLSLMEKESQLFDRMKKVIKNCRPKKTSKFLAVAILLILLAGTNAVYAFSEESGKAVREISAANAVDVPLDFGPKNAEEHMVLHADTGKVKTGGLQENLLSTGAVVYEMDWNIKEHEKTGIPAGYLEKGKYIRFYAGGITNGKSIRAVLRQPNNSIRYVEIEAGMVHTFQIEASGNYQFYLENMGTDSVRVLGGYMVYTKQE